MATERQAVSRDEAPDLEQQYRRFAELRRGSPVPGESPVPGTGRGLTLYRYDDCARVLRDPRTFSSSGYTAGIDLVLGRTILSMDDPEHKRHRDLVAHAFQQRAVTSWEGEIRAVCDELIDRFQPAGRVDLVAGFTNELPLRVTSRILGLPAADHARFHGWSMDLIGIAGGIERGFAASAALRDYFAGLVGERRRQPREDVISDLATAEIDGERLSDEAISSFLRLLLPAGVETTARSLPSLLHRLLGQPDQLDGLRADRSLMPQALEEGLRCDTPVMYIQRVATRDVEIGGAPLARGLTATLCLASANRDESRWPDPDRFDIWRPQLQNLAFAAGPHMCLGQHLARMESGLALNRLLDRLPRLRLDPERPAPPVKMARNGMPALASLPLLFDSGGSAGAADPGSREA